MLDVSSSRSEHQYKAVTWMPSKGVLMTVIAMVAGQIIAAVLVILLVQLTGMSSNESQAWTETTFGQFVLVVAAEAFTLTTLWLFFRKRWPGWAAFGFTRSPRISDVGMTLLGGVAYIVLLVAVTSIAGSLLHVDLDQKQEIGFESVVTGADRVFAFISLVLLPPIVEEVLFRGVLFGGFRKRLTFMWATLFTSLLFAFPHLLQGGGALLWVGAIDTFVLSVVLCTLRERTGSLWSSILLHMIKNGIAYVYLFIVVPK